MKNECNIIKDILPLYLENMVSDDTRKFVDEHLSQCPECKKELELSKIDISIEEHSQDENIPSQAMKKIKREIKKKRVVTGILSAAISAIVVILLFSYLTAPEYLPYTEPFDIITTSENNGVVSLSFNGEYELSQREQGVYSISIYNTAWNKLFGITKKQVISINPNGEEVNTIYYVSNGEPEDKVIYGINPIDNGGVITLPRLFLNYYFVTAMIIALILAIFYLLLRKKGNVKAIIAKVLFIPLSYVLSHVMIKGWSATSYSASRDFCLILLLAIPIYFVFYMIYTAYTAKSNCTKWP